MAAVLHTHSPGGGILSQHYLWRVPDDFCVEAPLSENQKVIDRLKQDLPIYHTRAMRRDFMNMYGRFTGSTKPVVCEISTENSRGMQVDLAQQMKVLLTNGSKKLFRLKMWTF